MLIKIGLFVNEVYVVIVPRILGDSQDLPSGQNFFHSIAAIEEAI